MADTAASTVGLSILVPVFNEVGNVAELHLEIDRVLRDFEPGYELIFVDDGSTDGTAALLASIQDQDPAHVRVAFLKRNCGQTAALSAALDLSRGSTLIPMDGDRQNDPADIPRLLAKLDEGYDVVSGWRRHRQDTLLTRKVPSWLANRLVAKISGVALHDFGCTMKAYRRKVLEGVRLYGEMHRFIPIFASWQGARVIELEVNHRARTAGKTKYGLGPDLQRRPRPDPDPLLPALRPAAHPPFRTDWPDRDPAQLPQFRRDALLQVSSTDG